MTVRRWTFYSLPASDSALLYKAVKSAHRKARGKLRKMLKRALEILDE